MLNRLKKIFNNLISWIENRSKFDLLSGIINWWKNSPKASKFWRWLIFLILSFVSINLLFYFFIFCFIFCVLETDVIVRNFSWLLLIKWSAIFILLIVSHELGHLLTAKLFSVPTGGIIFLPFFGAAAVIYKEKLFYPISRFKDFLFSIAGSIFSWLVIFLLLKLTPWISWSRIVIFCWLNISLFNLLPIYPMDGGRIFLDLIGGLKQRTAVTKIVGLIFWTLIIVAIALTVKYWPVYVVILMIILLLVNYIFLFRLGRIDPADENGAPMKIGLLIFAGILYGATIMGYLYLFKLMIIGSA